MDADRFDALARSLIALRTRRGTLGAVLGGTLGLLELSTTEADRNGNSRRRHDAGAEKKGGRGKRGKKGKRRKKKSQPPACGPGLSCLGGCCPPEGPVCCSSFDSGAEGFCCLATHPNCCDPAFSPSGCCRSDLPNCCPGGTGNGGCCGAGLATCCPPDSMQPCCPDNLDVCCEPGSQTPCCNSEFPECQDPVPGGPACCPANAPQGCPNGSCCPDNYQCCSNNPGCCPLNQTCVPNGCLAGSGLSTEDAAPAFGVAGHPGAADHPALREAGERASGPATAAGIDPGE